MTYRIGRSVVGPDFEAKVAAFVEQLQRWQLLENVPRPQADAHVENAVGLRHVEGQKPEFYPNFAVLEDLDQAAQAPEVPASQMHAIETSQSKAQEQEELRDVVMPGQYRLMTMRAANARAKAPHERTPEEAQAVADHEATTAKLAAAQLRAAEREAEIDTRYAPAIAAERAAAQAKMAALAARQAKK